MTDKPKITALVGCQVQSCAEEYSWPLADVRMWNGKPVCESCYNYCPPPGVKYNDDGDSVPAWYELPRITLADLKE